MATGAVDTAIAARRDVAREAGTTSSSARITLAVLTTWAIVIVVAHVLLERVQAAGANIRIQAAPLVGTFDLRVSGRIVASHLTSGKVDRTRPLCPYPQVATYTGTGSTDDAANFVCRMKQ